MKIFSLTLISLLSFSVISAEKDISDQWCASQNGVSQFRTKDGTYVDCLTDQYAVEAEFDNKWKEGIGQALHYAESTDKEAAILFIKRAKSRKNYHGELMRVINKYNLPIRVFIVEE